MTHQFYYALLDWGSGSRRRRAACIRHGIISQNDHVNIRDIRQFFVMNPNAVQIAADVAFNLHTQEYM